MAFCILCARLPPIDGSHIVPNFFIRHLKKNAPVPYLKHSTDLRRHEQDGWKGPYLCRACEEQLSRWEGELAKVYRQIVTMRTRGNRDVVTYSAGVWYAVASIHFRWMHLARNSPQSQGGAVFDSLYDSLRMACNNETSIAGVHLYLAGIEKVGSPAPQTPQTPGFNTYAFMSIDGFAFAYEDVDGNKCVVSCVKPPGLCLVAASGPLTNLIHRPTDVLAVALNPGGGTVTPLPLPATFCKLLGPEWDARVALMQAAYSAFSPRDLEKIKAWASSEDAPPEAADWHEADLELLRTQRE